MASGIGERVFDPDSFTPRKNQPNQGGSVLDLMYKVVDCIEKGIYNGNLSGSPPFIVSGVSYLLCTQHSVLYLSDIYI